MRKSSWKTWLLVTCAVCFLAAAAWRIPPINQLRSEHDLESTNPLDAGAVAGELPLPTVALFTFRSLAIDYLWIRADTLKNEGHYFDALHLARLICKLQPNLAQVWDFQAWNMAYNISVAMPTCPERWHWVDAGIRLLRDEGLYHNPEDTGIYTSLAWIFQHKIGEIADDCHRFYKAKLAYDVTRSLGPGITSNGELFAMAQTPLQWGELIVDPGVKKIVAMLQEVAPKFVDHDTMLQGLCEFRTFSGNYSPELHQFISDHRSDPSLIRIDAFARARVLREEWKMDPNFMLEINRRYGPVDFENDNRVSPLDWRLPFTHALYWALKGLQFTEVAGKDYLMLSRQVYQNLMDMFHYGRLQLYARDAPREASERSAGQEILSPSHEVRMEVFLSQDLRMFPVAYRAVLSYIRSYENAGERVPGGLVEGSVNMARTGVVNLYHTGRLKMARTYYRHLRERLPDRDDYDVPLAQFVEDRLREELVEPTIKYGSEYINTLLRQGYAFLALRYDDDATISESKAEKIYQLLIKEYSDQADRLALPSFSKLKWLAMTDFLRDPSIVPEIKRFLLRRLQIDQPERYQKVADWLQQQKSEIEDDPASEQ